MNYDFQKGFTLIELLLLVALMLLLGTMGTSFAARFFTQNAVENATDQLVGDYRKAQTNAMAGKNDSRWGVDYRTNTITLYRGNSYAGRVIAVDEKFTIPASVSITTSDVTFWDRTGTTSAATITITDNKGTTNTITINAQGMVTR